jgi:hypothetical protein
MSSHGFTTNASLDSSDVINGNNPREPTATFASALRYCLAKGRTIGCRVIQWADHFKVGTTVKREDEVPSSKAGVNSTVLKGRSETGADSLDDVDEMVVISNIRDMV